MSRLRIMQITNEELERRQMDGTMYADLVPIGKWECEVDFGNVAHYYCSECRKEGKGTDFCPNCGADMRSAEQTKTHFLNAKSITIPPIDFGENNE